ncbi:MAG: hypothetical protein ABIZ04_21615 [Opitutus sp.]
MTFTPKSALPRLTPESYLGRTSIFWTHTIADRKTGWLNDSFHLRFRELLCHVLARHGAVCPVFCHMPDHIHLLISGIDENCDQHQCLRLLRQEINHLIAPVKLQMQAHDHVLRDDERERAAFEKIAHYIQQNPVRKGLCVDWTGYAYTGCLVPGYFNLEPKQADFWERYWRIYNKIVAR